MTAALKRANLVGARVKFGFKELLWLATITLFFVNFGGWGIHIPLLFIPVLLMFLVREKQISKLPLIFLIFYSITYVVIIYAQHLAPGEEGNLLRYLIYPAVMFTLGFHLVKGDEQYKKTTRLLMAVIVSLGLFGVLCIYKTISLFGSMDSVASAFEGRRVAVNYWNNTFITATGINTFLSLGLSSLGVIFISGKGVSKLVKPLLFVVFILCAIGSALLGNRTGVVIVVASMVTIYLWAEKFTAKKAAKSFFLLMFAVLLILLYQADFMSIKHNVEESLLYQRFHEAGVAEDPRYAAWGASFWGMFEYPMGGRLTELPSVNYAHNLWLDVAYTAGVIPFLLLLIFSIMAIKALVDFVRSEAPTLLKGVLIGMYTAFLLTFFVEPIMEGWFTYFTVFCCVFGMLQRLNYERKTVPDTQSKPLI